MFDLLPEKEVARLRARRDELKRLVHSRTIWAMVEPHDKTEEEIKKLPLTGSIKTIDQRFVLVPQLFG